MRNLCEERSYDMYDIVIIGAGTAGLSAAIYGVRSGKRVVVLEGTMYGGQIVNTPEIENYPGIKNVSGFEFATNLYEQALELGAEIVLDKVEMVEQNEDSYVVKCECDTFKGKTVILATGSKNRKLGVELEEELLGKGVSYCATCDGMFFRDKVVAVAGGGNTALEDAGYLAAYCKKVYLVHRRDEFRGEEKLVQQLREKPNVEFVLDTIITGLQGTDKLEAMDIQTMKNGIKLNVAIDGLFVAVGREPENGIFSSVVDLDEFGYIVAGEDCKTKNKGIFVAGDCRTKKVRQLTTAAADGAVAALAACELV